MKSSDNYKYILIFVFLFSFSVFMPYFLLKKFGYEFSLKYAFVFQLIGFVIHLFEPIIKKDNKKTASYVRVLVIYVGIGFLGGTLISNELLDPIQITIKDEATQKNISEANINIGIYGTCDSNGNWNFKPGQLEENCNIMITASKNQGYQDCSILLSNYKSVKNIEMSLTPTSLLKNN